MSDTDASAETDAKADAEARTFTVTNGVYGVDIGLFGAGGTSVYLFDGAEPALVDAGTAASADRILAGIRACGVDPADLEHLVVSHVHTDHSGAAAALVDAADDLTVYIHESTASHLADPGALVASSKEAMGEHFELMGEQGPVPEDAVTTVSDDGLTVEVGPTDLELVHGPGHSPDHLAVHAPGRDALFAAECLGMYLERADRWIPPATLPNFDADVLADTIDELAGYDPDHVLLAHFGAWPGTFAEAVETAREELWRFDERIAAWYDRTGSVEATKARVAAELLDVAGPYDPVMESFYANLITRGYLRYQGVDG